MNDTEQKPGPEDAGFHDGQDDAQDQSHASDGTRRDDDRHGDGNSVNDDAGEDSKRPREIGGRKGPDPVRYGDWEKNGRCIDF